MRLESIAAVLFNWIMAICFIACSYLVLLDWGKNSPYIAICHVVTVVYFVVMAHFLKRDFDLSIREILTYMFITDSRPPWMGSIQEEKRKGWRW